MLLFKKKEALIKFLHHPDNRGLTIGFVPTMGALHQGHLALLKKAKESNDLTVCSIFVNPTQFDNPDDLKNYPRPIENDIKVLSENNLCDVVFVPSKTEMYPKGETITIPYPLGKLEQIFEGKHRQGHFQGVALIVNKLLQIVSATQIFLGQKDYQQCLVIQKLIDMEQLSVELVICPIQREADGLAMSSRNKHLSPSQRSVAGLLYQCLVSIEAQKHNKPFAIVQKECLELLKRKGVKPDYVSLADAATLEPFKDYKKERPSVALIAASVGKIRLIDNLVF